MSNQPAARPECDHHWITNFQQDIGLKWIRQCSQCGDFDADDLREQIAKIRAETLRNAAASFIDWDVIYGHEAPTPEIEESHKTAARLQDQAALIEKGGEPA